MNQQLGPLLYTISIWALPAIAAITFHEAAHGFAARLFGDDTAWRLGRVTFNPLRRIDPIGTILLPAVLLLLRSPFLFGYAKPVPINFGALRNARRDMAGGSPWDCFRTGLSSPLARLEPYGMMILIGVLFILPMIGAQMGLDFRIVSRVIAVVSRCGHSGKRGK